MTTALLTEGDLDRGQPPDLTSPHGGVASSTPSFWCRLHPADHIAMTCSTGAYQAVQGTGRSTRIVQWTGGTERSMVVDGYTWSRLLGTDVEVRALTVCGTALRSVRKRSNLGRGTPT